MGENIADIINRLRGKVGGSANNAATEAAPKQENSGSPESKAVMDNFLSQTPAVVVSEEEKKYTTEDLNNYVDSLFDAK